MLIQSREPVANGFFALLLKKTTTNVQTTRFQRTLKRRWKHVKIGKTVAVSIRNNLQPPRVPPYVENALRTGKNSLKFANLRCSVVFANERRKMK